MSIKYDFTIIRDTREQKGWAFVDCNVIDRKLDTGDYSIDGLEHILCIERKSSLSEFATNITSERFYKELERMSTFQHAFLLCEFDMYDIDKYPESSGIPKYKINKIKIKKPYILRCISQIQVKYNVHVVFCGTDSDDAQLIAYNIMKRVYEYNLR